MNKEEFLKKLKKNLKYLSEDKQNEILKKYDNLDNYDLDTVNIANEIYKDMGLNITVNKRSAFFSAIFDIIEELESKDKKRIGNILLFFLYLLLLLILIKLPFIYVRDMISNLFNIIFYNDIAYAILSLITEILYAITTILVFIKLIIKKAKDIK